MKKLITILICIFAIGLIQFATAEDEPLVLPFTFENGTVADADQMNAVLETIQEIINQNIVTVYDYGSPIGTISIFGHSSSPSATTTITHTSGMETWVHSDVANNWKIEYLLTDSNGGTMEIGRVEYDSSGTITKNLKYDPPILGVDLLNTKEIGKTWGGGYLARRPDGSVYEAETKTFTILAIEDVSVPAGTFENCIQVFHVGSKNNSVVWYAKGVGMVKRIGYDGLMELQSYTP